MSFNALPGYELVRDGLEDLASGTMSAAALLVLIGAHRLQRLGIEVPERPTHNPEHELYELLAGEHGDGAHAQYNALLGRLVSFEHAAERAT